MAGGKISINRAPVLTLWAAVVAQRSGHDWHAALTLGRALAGLNAQSKGQRLGIYEKKKKPEEGKAAQGKAAAGRRDSVTLLGREVPVVTTADGLRAASAGDAIAPQAVQKYLEQKFGEDLGRAREAFESLAQSMAPARLQAQAYALYEKFRPKIPGGKKGWGSKGELDLDLVRSLQE